MYEELIKDLEFYARQKENTLQGPLGALVKGTLNKEADTLRSAAQAIEALIAGQETLQSHIASLEEKLQIAQEANRKFMANLANITPEENLES